MWPLCIALLASVTTTASADEPLLVADIAPGNEHSIPTWLPSDERFTEFEGSVYFGAVDDAHGPEVWRYDGEEVSLLADIRPGSAGSNPVRGLTRVPRSFAVFDGALYFAADDGVHGTELWRFDGNATTRVGDLNPGEADATPQDLAVYGEALYFSADDGIHGAELWRLDAGSDQPVLVADIHPTSLSLPSELTVFGDALYFRARDAAHGTELWRYTEAAGASMVHDLYPGLHSSSPGSFAILDGVLYFGATNGSRDLWSYDDVHAPSLVADFAYRGASPHKLIAWDGALYFSNQDGEHGHELWTWDAALGARMLVDINPSGASSPGFFTLFQDVLYFRASEPVSGGQLWRYDRRGPPTLAMSSDSGNPRYVTVFDGSLVYAASYSGYGIEPWRWTPPPSLSPPTADAGDPRATSRDQTVTLDGSDSFSADFSTGSLRFDWSFVSTPEGSLAELQDADTAFSWFVVDLLGTYVVQLVVTDPNGLSSEPATVAVSSENLPPVADAGADQAVFLGQAAELDGSGSFDPDGDALSFSWEVLSAPPGSAATVEVADVFATLLPEVTGPYLVGLTVHDGHEASEQVHTTVSAIAAGDFASGLLADGIALVTAMPRASVTTPGNQRALVSWLSEAIAAVQAGEAEEAAHRVRKALHRSDGCVSGSAADGPGPERDWVITCDAQHALHDHLDPVLEALSFLGQ